MQLLALDQPIRFHLSIFIDFIGAFAGFGKSDFSFVTSVCPHGMAQLRLHGFSLNFIYEYFSKISRENSSFMELWQE